jgi:hypothetical protein
MGLKTPADIGGATASTFGLGGIVCGKIAIMKVSILAAVCDGDMIRRVEPKVLQDQSRS